MTVMKVECYSGQSYAERPRALTWEGQRHEVVEIVARWRFPGGLRFRVRVEDNRAFDLIYTMHNDEWDIQPAL
jgi:hypothetical protein